MQARKMKLQQFCKRLKLLRKPWLPERPRWTQRRLLKAQLLPLPEKKRKSLVTRPRMMTEIQTSNDEYMI